MTWSGNRAVTPYQGLEGDVARGVDKKGEWQQQKQQLLLPLSSEFTRAQHVLDFHCQKWGFPFGLTPNGPPTQRGM